MKISSLSISLPIPKGLTSRFSHIYTLPSHPCIDNMPIARALTTLLTIFNFNFLNMMRIIIFLRRIMSIMSSHYGGSNPIHCANMLLLNLYH